VKPLLAGNQRVRAPEKKLPSKELISQREKKKLLLEHCAILQGRKEKVSQFLQGDF
jgi:hypothetical protein